MSHTFPVNSGLINDWPYYGQYVSQADLDASKRQEDRLAQKIDSGDFDLNDICVFTCFAPSRIRQMVKDCNRHDAMELDAAIRSGIQAQSAQLGDMASYFIDAVVREFGATYAEQVAA